RLGHLGSVINFVSFHANSSIHVKEVMTVPDVSSTVVQASRVLAFVLLVTLQSGWKEKCMKPQWDPKISFVPDQKFYNINTSVMLTCPNGYWPSVTEITCVKQSPRHGLKVPHIIWYMKNSTGFWQLAAEDVGCAAHCPTSPPATLTKTPLPLPESCQRPQWGTGLRLVPDLKVYRKNEEVMLSCPQGLQPSYTHVRCSREEQTISRGKHEHRTLWLGRDSSGAWTHIRSSVTCVGKCQKPQWDPRILFVPDQRSYNLNETVILTCPVGYWLSHTEVSCMKQNPSQGSTASQNIWHVKNGRGRWQPVKSNMICVEVFQVDPGTLEVSSTSIKLNWTCSFPDACQHMQATCQLAGPSSPPLPEKPEQLQLDTSTGTLRWKALPSCRGEIIGYQLNFTARRAHDGTFLNFQQVTVNHSVTQYTPPAQSPGSKYTVTVQGLTAAGAGDASSLEFQAYISVVVWFMLSRIPLDAGMALQFLALTFLLVLVPLLEAQGQEEPDPPVQGAPRETEPDLDEYKKNEDVMLSCPEGFQPSYTHIRCSREVQTISRGKPVYREVWLGRASSSSWDRIRSSVECVEVLEVDPGTLEVSSTRIKLNWTCSFPDACQHMQATCRLAGPSSPPCEAEEVTGMEFLDGQMGTFTCPPLQPFTEYTVTISVPPSTVLFSWVIRTKETVPQKPEQLQLDASTGTLSWKALPSCRGEIIGYQVPWAHTQPLPPCSFVQASMQTIESPEDQQSLI
ncbi:UNVERIFIED_CONTAM: hypothetical protein H355_006645, partial [Colinus virginianus]